MEPIGTITQYFPLIDDETKRVLEANMKDAEHYHDFVHRLGESILSTDSPIMVVYFALHHAILASEYKLIDRIREKYEGHEILGPNLFYASAYQGTVEDIKKVHELANAVLAAEPEDWIKLEMNFMKFEADIRYYPKIMYQTETMNKIRELMESDPRFSFYESTLADHFEIRAHADGNTEERISWIDKGLQVTEKYDDRLRMAHFLIKKATIIKDTDRGESRRLLNQVYQIVDSSLGIPAFFSHIIDRLSVLDAIRGDFDSAIRRLLEVVSIRERLGLSSGNASLFLSTLYNVIGEPESGLEWGRMAESQFKSMPHIINRAILNQVWSLVLLKKMTEAQVLIDTSRESILKSGHEGQLAWLHFVTGILEMEQGEYSLATDSLEQALRIYEQQGWAYQIQIIFLHQLAKAEVYSCKANEVVSPSLAILEDKATSEDLPGILGLVLLLKADISIINDDESSLREIILELRSLFEEHNLLFLKPYHDRLLERV